MSNSDKRMLIKTMLNSTFISQQTKFDVFVAAVSIFIFLLKKNKVLGGRINKITHRTFMHIWLLHFCFIQRKHGK